MNSSIQLLIVLILLSGFFSGSETALTSLSQAKVRSLVDGNRRFSKIIARLKKHPNKLLITVLIGNNVANIWASVTATTLAQSYFGDQIIAYIVGVMTFMILVFGEIIPKTLSQRFNVVVSQFCSPFLYILSYLLYPIIFLLEKMIKFFIWTLGKEKFKSVTEEEVIAMLNIGHEEGEFNKQESQFIQNIFEFSDTTVEEIMVNRNEIEAFSGDLSIEKALKMINKSSHSRIPIFDGSIDNFIGYTTIKDLLKFSRRKTSMKKKLKDFKLHKILFFPVTKPINKIFRNFQQKRVHIAIILDEFGSSAGLVTIEDVLEEIVGEIVDESDIEEQAIKKLGKNSYSLEANTTLEEVFCYHKFHTDIPAHKSIAFLIIKTLGAFPREGEKVTIQGENVEFIVEKMSGKTIQKILMKIKKKSKKKT